MSDATDSTRLRGIDWSDSIAAAVVAILPAFGAYVLVSVAAGAPLAWPFPLAWLGFTSLFAGATSWGNRVGSGLFWLAIEAFLAPLAIGIAAWDAMAAQAGSAATMTGAALGGTVAVVVTAVLMWTVGAVLLLVGRRLED